MDADAGEYIKDFNLLQRKFNFLARSIDLKLKIILAKMEMDPPERLEEKIEMFLKARPDIDARLAEKLLQFNRYCKSIDKGSAKSGADVPEFLSEGQPFSFGRSEQAEIDDDFEQIMAGLTEISDNLPSPEL